jgi:hypothetical protein
VSLEDEVQEQLLHRDRQTFSTGSISGGAKAGRSVHDASLSSGDPMAHGSDLSKLFDIDMNELYWLLALIAQDRLCRLEAESRFSPRRRKTRLTVAADTPTSAAIRLPV